jgi:N-acetylmuramoyl-L-alanine amidase CwlA
MEAPSNLRVALIPAGQGIRASKTHKYLNPEGVCWHWTANVRPGANAEMHRRYFHNAENGTHYVLDDKEIIHLVPETEVVWHAGPDYLLSKEIKKKYPRGTNLSLIGVEICVNQDRNEKKTYENAVALGVYLCQKYNWDPEKDFVRHYDCTGKDCPQFWTKYVPGGEQAWADFKKEVKRRLVNTAKVKTRTETVVDTKVYLDGKLKGEGIIVNNISYLPVRAMENTPPFKVEKFVNETKSVYLKSIK